MRLATERGIRVVATATRCDEIVRAVRVHPVDVAVLAVDGQPGGFLDVTPQLLAERPELKLVGVTGADDTTALARAIRAGFRAWVPKEVGVCVLLDVLQAVCRGETWISPGPLTRLLHVLVHDDEDRRRAEEPLSALTAREREVLVAMSSGATRDEIAGRLHISANTVRTHTQSILTKLDVHTSLAAVTLARRAGVA
ncbi:LuxR C-terminal-related transcriptional regulator [Blastococcus sp. SYSU D00669]